MKLYPTLINTTANLHALYQRAADASVPVAVGVAGTPEKAVVVLAVWRAARHVAFLHLPVALQADASRLAALTLDAEVIGFASLGAAAEAMKKM